MKLMLMNVPLLTRYFIALLALKLSIERFHELQVLIQKFYLYSFLFFILYAIFAFFLYLESNLNFCCWV